MITQNTMVLINAKVKIIKDFYTGYIGHVCKVPTYRDKINMKKKWIDAGMGEWGDGTPIPDSYHVRLMNCKCGSEKNCMHVITYLQEEDIQEIN